MTGVAKPLDARRRAWRATTGDCLGAAVTLVIAGALGGLAFDALAPRPQPTWAAAPGDAPADAAHSKSGPSAGSTGEDAVRAETFSARARLDATPLPMLGAKEAASPEPAPRPTAPPPPPAHPIVAAPPAPPSPPSLRLHGVVDTLDGAIALIESGGARRLRLGDDIDGWRVVAIDRHGMTLSRADRSHRYVLRAVETPSSSGLAPRRTAPAPTAPVSVQPSARPRPPTGLAIRGLRSAAPQP